MNNTYIFSRRKSGGTPATSNISNQYVSNKRDSSQEASKHAPPIVINQPVQVKETSASPVSRVINQRKDTAHKGETHAAQEESVLFVKKKFDKRESESPNNRAQKLQQQIKKQSDLQDFSKFSHSSLSEMVIDEEATQVNQAKNVKNNRQRNTRGSHGVTSIQGPQSDFPIIGAYHLAMGSMDLNAARSQVHSPSDKTEHVKTKGIILNNYQAVKKTDHPNGKKQKTYLNVSNNDDKVGFFQNLNQVFNKTVIGGSSTPAAEQQTAPPRKLDQHHHSNGPSNSNNHQLHHSATPSAGIVINKPIVIQFQNKKITFKNHHHHHHHHYHGDGNQSGSIPSNRATNQKTSKSNPCTKKGSPEQLSPRIAKNAAPASGSQIEESFVAPSTPMIIAPQQFVAHQQINQHVKLTPNQQNLMIKMKKPPIQQAQQVAQPTINATNKESQHTQIVQSPHIVVTPPQNKYKKKQVNQILQQILSFEPQNLTQPPSPKSIEFSTQQVQKRILDDGSSGRRIMQPSGNNSNTLGRPRQSGNPEIGSTLAGPIKINNIGTNFGISKTQDSKKPQQKDNTIPPSYTNDMNILEMIKNHSNENMSLLGGRSDHNQGGTVLVNNSSFSSNFRSQYPTGTKLILNTSQHVQEPPRKKHTRYQTQVNSNGIPSPNGLAISLTMDNSKQAPLNRPKMPQNIHQNQQVQTRMMTSKGERTTQQQPGKALKKKKVSIGSAHQALRNSVLGSHNYIPSASNGSPAQQVAQQIDNTQSSRVIKKNQLQQQQALVAKLAHERHLSNMKEQLIKAAYYTSFNSPNRLSQHHPTGLQIPIFPNGGGSLAYQSTLDDRTQKNKIQKLKINQQQLQLQKQAHSLSNSRKMSATRGP